MSNRNIQMKKRNGGSWDNMYPVTLDSNVFDKNGNSVSEQLADSEQFRKDPYVLYSNFMNRLNRAEAVEILCIGDSITAGADNASGTLRTITADNGESQNVKTVEKPYPVILRDILRETYNNDLINVKNMGWSGDTTEGSFKHWTLDRDSDATIIMLGTNDSNYTVPISTYLDNIDRIVKRHYKWQSAVILATPPLRQNRNKYWRMNPYRIALMEYAKTNNIPCLDMAEETSNYSSYAYSDPTHFTGLGYAEMARAFASLLIGYGSTRSTEVANGSYLQANDDIINLVSRDPLIDSKKYPGPGSQEGYVAQTLQLKPGQKFNASIYATQENLVMYPNAEFLGDGSKLTIYVSNLRAKNLSNAFIGGGNETGETLERRVRHGLTYGKSNANYKNNTILNLTNVGPEATLQPVIILPNRGYHLLEISNDGTDIVNLFGFEFVSTLVYRMLTNNLMSVFE